MRQRHVVAFAAAALCVPAISVAGATPSSASASDASTLEFAQEFWQNWNKSWRSPVSDGLGLAKPPSAPTRQDIEASRSEHAGRISPNEARALVAELSPSITASDAIVPNASEVQEVVSPHVLRRRGRGGKSGGVIVTSMPVARNGRLADLRWESGTDGFRVARSVVDDVTAPEHAGETFRVGDLRLQLGSQRAAAPGIPSGEAVVYANEDIDRDLVVRSTPTGLMAAWSLRSPSASPTIHTDLDLPEGIRIETERSGAIRFQDGEGQPVGSVSPATARDAAGQPVEVTTEVRGGEIVYRVQADDARTVWPVNVDPIYDVTWQTGNRDITGWFKQSTPRGESVQPFSYVTP